MVIVVFAISFKKVESALYALIAMFINATVVDVVLMVSRAQRPAILSARKVIQ